MRSSMAIYNFNTEDAKEYGVDGAIMLFNLCFWIAKNKANKKHYHEGVYWTYNSNKAFEELFPFWNYQKIGRILRKLEYEGAIISSNFNTAGFDKTKWYSVLNSRCLNLNNGALKNDQPIPDNKPDNKQHIPLVANAPEQGENKVNKKPSPSSGKKCTRPPELAEVLAWAGEWAEKKDKPLSQVRDRAKEAFDYYNRLDWQDRDGKKVENWKNKIAGVWFSDDKLKGNAKPIINTINY